MGHKNYRHEERDFSDRDYNKNDYKNDLKEVGKSLSDKVKNIGTNFKENLDEAQNRMEDFGETIKEKGRYMTSQFKNRIQNNPWPYIGGAAVTALAIGFLAGRQISKQD